MSAEGVEKSSNAGRKAGATTLLARELGVSRRIVQGIGVECYEGMSEEARALLIGMAKKHREKALDGVLEPITAQKRQTLQKAAVRGAEIARARKGRIAWAGQENRSL